MDVRIEQVGTGRYRLGEGPLWDAEESTLHWVDVLGRAVWRHRPGTDEFRHWPMPDVVSSLALRRGGGAVVTLAKGFFTLDFDSGACDPMGPAIEAGLDTRFNDGKVDRQGRFIAGTIHNRITDPIGSMYRLGTDRMVTKLDGGFICSNGPCWSLDGRTMYFTDSMRSEIYAYEYDRATGDLGPRRVLINLGAHGIDCAPDGCTVDAEGFLWSALCLAGKVARIAPDGTIERVVQMPVEYVTSVIFGGEKLDTLYVTSLNIPLRGKAPEEPNAGGLFAVRGLGVRGVPEPRFGG